ncbi:MAG: chromate transporter [Allobaculum sp.]|nr:chromate transporter [Allobaculum sp.]
MDVKLLLILFWEFFKTGLFSVGGGLATIPFLYEMMNKYHWFTQSDLLNMIAISESTPGPVGINMATYVGYHTTGNHILGALTTTFALVLPSVIIICIIARVLKTYRENKYVEEAFFGLRPATCGLILTAALGVFSGLLFPSGQLIFDQTFWINVALIAVVGALAWYFRKLHPIALIVLCAVMGIVLQL